MATPTNYLPRAERFAIPITILYRSPGEADWRPGLTENISRSGVLFRADRHLAPDTPLEMMLDFPTILAPPGPGSGLRRGRVVRAMSPSPLERRPAVAAAFLDLQVHAAGGSPAHLMAVGWGIVGCGDVTEVKSGPGFQRADGSSLVAVMRRDREKAEDYARRHGVARAYDRVEALVADPDVTAVYVATPPASHLAIARQAAAAGKPCLVEKPMAMNHAECVAMIEVFRARGVPLWVAYYRRALPRFVEVRARLAAGSIGRLTSVHVQITDRMATGAALTNWRFDPAIAGAGLFFDLASHCFDLVDFLAGPIGDIRGFALNTGGTYAAEDVTSAAFACGQVAGTGIFNFNADEKTDRLTLTGTDGTIVTPVFTDGDVVVDTGGLRDVLPVRNPPHVHQPLIQTIVDEMRGRGRCESTGESGARASWAMDRCLESYRIGQGSMNSMRVPSGS